jgi:hypothetical protein
MYKADISRIWWTNERQQRLNGQEGRFMDVHLDQYREEGTANHLVPWTLSAPRNSTILDEISPYSRRAGSIRLMLWRSSLLQEAIPRLG